MDISGRDLQQLCVAAKFNTQINRTIRAWIDADTDAKVDSRMIDQWIESDFKTAFNCLLNSYHATEKSIQNFLNQQINSKDHFVNRYGKNQQGVTATNSLEAQCTCYEKIFTPLFSLSNQDLRGITPLHVAVYRNSLHVDKIADLMLNWKRSSNEYLSLDEDTKEVSLASIPMACGSYPLHILTGQNLTLKEELLKILLHADPRVPFIDDVNGDNPISLLWKNTLVSYRQVSADVLYTRSSIHLSFVSVYFLLSDFAGPSRSWKVQHSSNTLKMTIALGWPLSLLVNTLNSHY